MNIYFIQNMILLSKMLSLENLEIKITKLSMSGGNLKTYYCIRCNIPIISGARERQSF